MKHIKEYKEIDFDDFDIEEVEPINIKLRNRIIEYIKFTHETHENISKYSAGIVPNSFFGETLCEYLESYEYSVKFPHIYPDNFHTLLKELFMVEKPNKTNVYKLYKLMNNRTIIGRIIKKTFDNNHPLMYLRIEYGHREIYKDIINDKYK